MPDDSRLQVDLNNVKRTHAKARKKRFRPKRFLLDPIEELRYE